MAVTLNTESKTWRELIGNGRYYVVPSYQRDYAWETEDWEDLWADMEGIGSEGYHYMGYIVLQNTEGKTYTIIDGQQRLTTLSTFYLAAIKLLKQWIDEAIEPDLNQSRQEELERGFIGNKSATAISISPKLKLNRNNNGFYQDYLIQYRTPQNSTRRKPSEKKLERSFKFYFDKLSDKFNDSKDGNALAQFLENEIAEKLIFTVINVDNDLNAYKVFETLNARGVKLSTSDLLKNYLFSVAFKNSDIDLDRAESQWQNISESLGSDDFSTFLRHFWNSNHRLERKQTLFKTIKKEIDTPQRVMDLLNKLQDSVEIYAAFSNPDSDIWDKSRDDNQSSRIDELLLFGVSQCYPLLLSAYQNLDKKEFTKVLRLISVISFRYNVISGLNPNELENAFNEVAIGIAKKELKTQAQIFELLKNVYVEDERFKANFAIKSFNLATRNRKIVRYVLFAIENHVSNRSFDSTDANFTIEHILPKNPSEVWTPFFKIGDYDAYSERLGNYTLLEDKLNKSAGDEGFEVKTKIYRKSKFEITNKNLEYTEWTPETLQKRQEKMAESANTIWRIQP